MSLYAYICFYDCGFWMWIILCRDILNLNVLKTYLLNGCIYGSCQEGISQCISLSEHTNRKYASVFLLLTYISIKEKLLMKSSRIYACRYYSPKCLVDFVLFYTGGLWEMAFFFNIARSRQNALAILILFKSIKKWKICAY